MPGTYDRFTVNWTGSKELAEAEQVRQRCRQRHESVNAWLKRLIRAAMQQEQGRAQE